MNKQRLIELEVLRLSSRPGSMGVNDCMEARLACISMLYRLNLIDDATYLSLSVSTIQEWDSYNDNSGKGA